MPLEALLWPVPAEIAAGVKTEQLYVVPQRAHWPVYLPGLQRFVTVYDFTDRLACMRDPMRYGVSHGMDVERSTHTLTHSKTLQDSPRLSKTLQDCPRLSKTLRACPSVCRLSKTLRYHTPVLCVILESLGESTD